jgi:Fe-S-cluster-containing hydrogenase component 2
MLFKMDKCGGCRTCELACGYHHEGVFRPAMSSIRIVEKEGEPGYAVMLEEETTGSTKACDGCEGLDVPLCVEYCRERDDLAKMILELMEVKCKMSE